MGWGYANLGAGAGGLDLTIKSGSLESKPTTARGNFLYIVSEIPVKSYVLSYLEPPAGSEGAYWLKISHEGEPLLNLLKKNQLYLYLDSVYVYKDAKWKKCHAFLWHDGSWIEYAQSLVIFKATPGVLADDTFKVDSNARIGTTEKGYLIITSAGGESKSTVHVKKKYTLDKFKTLHVQAKAHSDRYTRADNHYVFLTENRYLEAIVTANISQKALSWIDIPLENIGHRDLTIGVYTYLSRDPGETIVSEIWAE